MKKGICLTAVYPEAMYKKELLCSLLRQMKEEGQYDCAEFYFEGTQEEEREIRTVLMENGLTAVFLAGFPMKRDQIDLSSPEETQRQKAVVFCMDCYRRAQNIGADKMLILSGPKHPEADRKTIISQTQKSLLELHSTIQGEKTEITLEFFPTEREPYLAVGDTELVYEIFSGIEAGIGITFDTSHVAQLGENVLESFRKLKPWIHHLHLANSMSADPKHKLYGDKHPLFTLENGDFSLSEIRSLYQSMKHEGLLEQIAVCSMEIISRKNEDACYAKISREAAYIWNE